MPEADKSCSPFRKEYQRTFERLRPVALEGINRDNNFVLSSGDIHKWLVLEISYATPSKEENKGRMFKYIRSVNLCPSRLMKL